VGVSEEMQVQDPVEEVSEVMVLWDMDRNKNVVGLVMMVVW